MDGSPTTALQVRRGPLAIGWRARFVTVQPSTAVTWSDEAWAWTRLRAGRRALEVWIREELRRDWIRFLETDPVWCPICGNDHPLGSDGSKLQCPPPRPDQWQLTGLFAEDGITEETP